MRILATVDSQQTVAIARARAIANQYADAGTGAGAGAGDESGRSMNWPLLMIIICQVFTECRRIYQDMGHSKINETR